MTSARGRGEDPRPTDGRQPNDLSATPPISQRKDDHLTYAADRHALHLTGAGLDRYRIRHRALPERDIDEVDLRTDFLGATLGAPILISAMTGGTDRARIVNARLSEAAAGAGFAMGLGSGRAVLEQPELRGTYAVTARPPLLLANLGAVQLRLGVTPPDAERLVELLDADGLILHLNPIQEAVQPGGDRAFRGLAERIAPVVERLRPRPVIVKEVGFGLAPEDVALLIDAGVAAIDVAGAGGTNWALVEGQRDETAAEIGAAFADWGWPTARSLTEAQALTAHVGVPLIASGGIRHGVDAAVALALGAQLVGLARPMLIAALEDRTVEKARVLTEQLRIAVWAAGVDRPSALAREHLIDQR